MRTVSDRIRQAISFEVIGLVLIIMLGAPVFGIHMGDLGVIAVAGSLIATAWNYVYNLGFDHLLAWLGARKTPAIRVVHAILFEAGILLATLPLIVWWLDVTLAQAFVMDLALAGFYVVYAFVFTWCYDRVFPVETPGRGATGSCGCP